jgi:uncharacterized DUF497 family protein
MRETRFEWDEEKDRENQTKHGLTFITAQQAFLDPHRIIAEMFLMVPEKIVIIAWGVWETAL